MYGPASCGTTGGPWCNYVMKNNNYVPLIPNVKPADPTIVGSYRDTSNRALRNGPGSYGFTR